MCMNREEEWETNGERTMRERNEGRAWGWIQKEENKGDEGHGNSCVAVRGPFWTDCHEKNHLYIQKRPRGKGGHKLGSVHLLSVIFCTINNTTTPTPEAFSSFALYQFFYHKLPKTKQKPNMAI